MFHKTGKLQNRRYLRVWWWVKEKAICLGSLIKLAVVCHLMSGSWCWSQLKYVEEILQKQNIIMLFQLGRCVSIPETVCIAEAAAFVLIFICVNAVVTRVFLDHSHRIFNVLCLHDVTEHSPGRLVGGSKGLNL